MDAARHVRKVSVNVPVRTVAKKTAGAVLTAETHQKTAAVQFSVPTARDPQSTAFAVQPASNQETSVPAAENPCVWAAGSAGNQTTASAAVAVSEN